MPSDEDYIMISAGRNGGLDISHVEHLLSQINWLSTECAIWKATVEYYADEGHWMCMGNMDLPHHASDACCYDTWSGNGQNGFTVAQQTIKEVEKLK